MLLYKHYKDKTQAHMAGMLLHVAAVLLASVNDALKVVGRNIPLEKNKCPCMECAWLIRGLF